MESFNIMMLSENISINQNKEYWKLYGTTEINLDVIKDDLAKMCTVTSKNNEYVFKQCIDIAKNIRFFKVTRPANQFTVDTQINLIEREIISAKEIVV